MATDTRTPTTTAETVSALEAARSNLVLQDDDGTRFACPLGPFLPLRVPPDRAAEDGFLREMIRRRAWLFPLVALSVLGGAGILSLGAPIGLFIGFLTALHVALVSWRWWRFLAATRGWPVRSRLPLRHWYRLAFRQRAHSFWDRSMSDEPMPLIMVCMVLADGNLGLGILLVFLLQPEMTLRMLLDLSLLAGRLVPAARRTC